jgi:hypothetical protein
MLAQGKKDLITDMLKKQLRTGKVKPTELRTHATLFGPSSTGKAGLIHSKPSTGRSHR